MNQDQLYHWKGVIASNFKDLSGPLQKGLAIFSLAVMESRHCPIWPNCPGCGASPGHQTEECGTAALWLHWQ